MKITDLRRNALVIHVNCALYFPIGVQLNINKITENFEKFIWIVRAMCTFFSLPDLAISFRQKDILFYWMKNWQHAQNDNDLDSCATINVIESKMNYN